MSEEDIDEKYDNLLNDLTDNEFSKFIVKVISKDELIDILTSSGFLGEEDTDIKIKEIKLMKKIKNNFEK